MVCSMVCSLVCSCGLQLWSVIAGLKIGIKCLGRAIGVTCKLLSWGYQECVPLIELTALAASHACMHTWIGATLSKRMDPDTSILAFLGSIHKSWCYVNMMENPHIFGTLGKSW